MSQWPKDNLELRSRFRKAEDDTTIACDAEKPKDTERTTKRFTCFDLPDCCSQPTSEKEQSDLAITNAVSEYTSMPGRNKDLQNTIVNLYSKTDKTTLKGSLKLNVDDILK